MLVLVMNVFGFVDLCAIMLLGQDGRFELGGIFKGGSTRLFSRLCVRGLYLALMSLFVT